MPKLFTAIKISRLSYYSSYALQKMTDMWTGKSVRRTDNEVRRDRQIRKNVRTLSIVCFIPSYLFSPFHLAFWRLVWHFLIFQSSSSIKPRYTSCSSSKPLKPPLYHISSLRTVHQCLMSYRCKKNHIALANQYLRVPRHPLSISIVISKTTIYYPQNRNHNQCLLLQPLKMSIDMQLPLQLPQTPAAETSKRKDHGITHQ